MKASLLRALPTVPRPWLAMGISFTVALPALAEIENELDTLLAAGAKKKAPAKKKPA